MTDRRSAKQVVEDYANELLARKNDQHAEHKLLALETIANRMSWTGLFNKLRFRQKPKYYWQDDER